MEILSEVEFVGKALFFPKKGILVIGDLHLGYNHMLNQAGIFVPQNQVKETISSLSKILDKIESPLNAIGTKIKKIVFLGDLKHAFTFQHEEKDDFLEIYEFLQKRFGEDNIILIKGNHDTIDYSYGKIRPFYVDGEIAFVHGHKYQPEIYNPKIKIVVTGHLHPSIILQEKHGVKREEYKCFLEGKYKGKIFIVLPSFLEFIEGIPVNEFKEYFIESFSIIPKKEILKFKIYVVGEGKVYEFGRIGDL